MNGSQIMETNTGSRKITTWQKAGKKSMVNGITCVLQEVWQRMYGRQGQKVTGITWVRTESCLQIPRLRMVTE